jgi:hypothetical protein
LGEREREMELENLKLKQRVTELEDHIDPYSKSFRSVANIACLCPMCHNIKSRMERLQALEEETDADAA